MKLETIEISELSFDPSNARLHPEKNLEAIKGSLRKFKQQKPIVVDRNNVVVAGNGTLQAALSLGWKKIEIVRTELSGAEAIAFALADNRTSELAEWDMDILGSQLQGLFEDGFEVGEIGFDLSDLNKDTEMGSVTGSKELSESDFSQFDNTCPKCGFEFDNK